MHAFKSLITTVFTKIHFSKKFFFYNSCCVIKTTLMTHRKGLYRSKSTFSFMFYSFIGMDIEGIIAFYHVNLFKHYEMFIVLYPIQLPQVLVEKIVPHPFKYQYFRIRNFFLCGFRSETLVP